MTNVKPMCPNSIVHLSDTDIFVCGLGLKEAGWLSNKCIIIERKCEDDCFNK